MDIMTKALAGVKLWIPGDWKMFFASGAALYPAAGMGRMSLLLVAIIAVWFALVGVRP